MDTKKGVRFLRFFEARITRPQGAGAKTVEQNLESSGSIESMARDIEQQARSL